nr:hypothetical protein [Lewinella sp. IMCC34191]
MAVKQVKRSTQYRTDQVGYHIYEIEFSTEPGDTLKHLHKGSEEGGSKNGRCRSLPGGSFADCEGQ